MSKDSQKSRPARRQMPKWIEPFDDDRGIVWRSYNYAKRFNIPRTAHFLRAYATGTSFERPVFVIGAPRSGTTLTFEILSQHPDLASLGHEGHDIWRKFHHPRKTGWDSDVIAADRANPKKERRFAEAFIRARTTSKPHANRFVEKTVDTTLRVEYILSLFPDAHFVAIHRDPCTVISSIINGWHDPDGRFRAYFIPDTLNIPNYEHKHRWCFTLIPGWRDLKSKPIPEIAFHQWAAYAQGLADARKLIAPDKLTEIRMNELLDSPGTTLQSLMQQLDLSMSEETQAAMIDRAKIRVNSTNAGPQINWRNQNEAAVKPMLSQIAQHAKYVGFSVDTHTGDSRPADYSSEPVSSLD